MRWKYNRYMHDYLGCVKAVDESVGRVLDYLDEEGLAENTIVVYSSDQGFYLGEHGWFDKRWIFEESLRTPLLVRWPGVAKPGSAHATRSSRTWTSPRRFSRPPGSPIPAEMQGRSLVPLLKGQTPADWRTSFYYHYYEYPGPHHVPPALRRRHRPLQAGPLLRARHRLLGAVRPRRTTRTSSRASSAFPDRHGSRKGSSESWIVCARISRSIARSGRKHDPGTEEGPTNRSGMTA